MSVVPCLKITVDKPVWKRATKMCLLGMTGLAFFILILGLATGAPLADASSLVAAILIVLSVPYVVCVMILYAIDKVRSRNLSRLSSIQADELPMTPTTLFEERVRAFARRGSLRIPVLYAREHGRVEAETVLLLTSEHKHIAAPSRSSVPFEPLVVDRDLDRALVLYTEFVLKQTVQTRPQKSSGSRRQVITGVRMIAGAAIYAATLIFLAMNSATSIWVFLVGGAPLLLLLGISLHRNVFSAPTCWIMPGAIAVRSPRRGRSDRILIFRPGDGTLWYDAQEQKLYLPVDGRAFRTVRVPPLYGLLAIWAWLNEAEAPETFELGGVFPES